METPPVELFTNRRRTGSGLHSFCKTLQEGVPTLLPEPWALMKSGQLGGGINRLPFKIALRTFNGKIWVMRLPKEAE